MVTVTINSHRYTKVETTDMSFGADTFQPRLHEHEVKEIVVAYFKLEGGEPFTRYRHSTQKLVATAVRITFTSKDGKAWQTDRWDLRLITHNLKKDGSLGAIVDIDPVSNPQWAQDLIEKDGDGRSDVFDWIRAEYPR